MRVLEGQSGGTIQVPALAAGTVPGKWEQMASMSHRVPTPVVMQVSTVVNAPGSPTMDGNDFDCRPYVSPDAIGTPDFFEGPFQAALRITYGAGGVLQRRIVDPISGSYQLPPCVTVKVEARAYNRQPATDGFAPYTIGVALCVGSMSQAARYATHSGIALISAGFQRTEMIVAQGCEYVRVGGGVANTDVVLTLQRTQPAPVIDYNVPSWASQVPDLVPTARTPPSNIIIDKDGTGLIYLFVQQLIRL